jgi:uncharacterized Zn finger protein (UPF0148 family)
MTEIGEEIDGDIDKTISTRCIKGHKFQVPKEKIQTSSTGKSFVTLCPKCNGVARLKKDEVYGLFGVNPRDHIAVGNLFSSLAIGNVPRTGETSAVPPTVSADVPGTPVSADPSDDDDPEIDESGDDDGDDSDADEDDEDDEDDDEDEDDDTEYTAVVETTPDITGKKKTVKRFRVLSDEDEPEDDSEEDDPRDRTPIQSPKKVRQPVKKTRGKVSRRDYEEEDMDEEEPQRSRKRSAHRRSPTVLEEDVFDPNEVLKDLIEESGLDENTVGRIFDYIDMQPDGWQPAAAQGVLQLYLSPASAQKISQRYQAEIYKEDKKRTREQQMMNLIGTPSGNMRLNDTSAGMNLPPMNAPLQQQGFINPGMNPQRASFPPQGGYGAGGFQQPGFHQFPPQGAVDPYAPRRDPDGYGMGYRANQPRGVSAYEVERLIDSKLDGVVEKLAKAMGETKREDAIATEAKELRMMMMEMMKERMSSAVSPSTQPQQNPQVAMMMQNQSDLLGKLLTHTLEKKKDDDPMNNPVMKIILQEVLSKKPTSAPPLANTSEELSQRIQLQRLANDLEISQAEFKDKQEGRAFTRDLAGQALSKIGESVAAAYIETQRIQAEAAKDIAARQAAMAASAAASPQILQSPDVQTTPAAPVSADQSDMHKVRGIKADDGTVKMACPTCGSDMFSKIGDTHVKCGTCGTSYNAITPKITHVDDDSTEKPVESKSGVTDQKPSGDSKKPKYDFPVYESPSEGNESGDNEQTPGETRDDWGSGSVESSENTENKPKDI